MLRFALLAGCGWEAVLALATTIVMAVFAAPLDGFFGERLDFMRQREVNQFFHVFFQRFAGSAPLLIVAAVLAAGTLAVLREMRRSAAQSRQALDAVTQRASAGSVGSQLDNERMRDPLKILKLEIDVPGRND